jgi:DNA-binding LytR/AlgR family response regulator
MNDLRAMLRLGCLIPLVLSSAAAPARADVINQWNEQVLALGGASRTLAMVQVAILLDWQMPELDGIAVVRMLKKDVMPLVAFVTAYDEYAVTAFALNAVDYLLKPVDKARLRETLNRARERIEHAEILTEQASRARWHTCGAVEHRPRIACEPIAVKNSPRTFPEAVRATSRWPKPPRRVGFE